MPAFISECRCMLLNTQIKPKQHLAMTNCTAYSVFFLRGVCEREREFTVRCMDTAMLTTGHRREGVSATDLTSPRKRLAAPVASSPSTGAKLGRHRTLRAYIEGLSRCAQNFLRTLCRSLNCRQREACTNVVIWRPSERFLCS